jgi:hypothetical protein
MAQNNCAMTAENCMGEMAFSKTTGSLSLSCSLVISVFAQGAMVRVF